MPTPDPLDKPMAEAGKHPQGADVGGMRSTADAGLADAAQRSMERADASAAPAAGAAAPTPRASPQATPRAGAATGERGAPAGKEGKNDDDEEPWRHPPVTPKDEGVLESLGRAVSEAVTGPSEGKDGKQKG